MTFQKKANIREKIQKLTQEHTKEDFKPITDDIKKRVEGDKDEKDNYCHTIRRIMKETGITPEDALLITYYHLMESLLFDANGNKNKQSVKDRTVKYMKFIAVAQGMISTSMTNLVKSGLIDRDLLDKLFREGDIGMII